MAKVVVIPPAPPEPEFEVRLTGKEARLVYYILKTRVTGEGKYMDLSNGIYEAMQNAGVTEPNDISATGTITLLP